MRSLSASIAHLFLERRSPADRRRKLPIDLRARLHLLAGREIVENLSEALGREVLVIIVVDLRHRGVDAGPETLNLDPGELAIAGDLALVSDALSADLFKIVGAAQPAWRGATKLHMEFSDRPQIEHRVKRRDLKRADMRHAEEIRDVTDRCLRQPAAMLLLRPPQERNDRRLLPPWRKLRGFLLRPGKVVLAEGKVLRLHFRRREAADTHRSTSPNTMSIEPRMADTSASMWPRVKKSMACRCAKPGGRILHL